MSYKFICDICKKEYKKEYFDFKQNKCYLHCEKDSWFDEYDNGIKNWTKSIKSINKFWSLIQGEMNSIVEYRTIFSDRTHNQFYEFKDVVFPKHQDEIEYLAEEDEDGTLIRDNRDEMGTNFYSFLYEHNDLNRIVDSLDITFNNCKFLDSLNLNKYSFKNSLTFKNCSLIDISISNNEYRKEFQADLFFLNTDLEKYFFKNIQFKKNFKISKKLINFNCENCYFDKFSLTNINNEIKKLKIIKTTINKNFNLVNSDEIIINLLDFSFSNINGKFKISNNICINEGIFYNTTFENLANFYQVKFMKSNFERADFKDIVVFSEAEFYLDLNFKYTRFLGKMIFRDTVIKKKLNLRETIIDSDASFLDITSIKRKKNLDGEFIGEPKDIEVANRESARIIKNHFDSQNNTIEANRFYKLEMKKRKEELKLNSKEKLETDNDFFERLVFYIHEYSSNHAQSWALSLFWIFLFSISYSLFKYNFVLTSDELNYFQVKEKNIKFIVIKEMLKGTMVALYTFFLIEFITRKSIDFILSRFLIGFIWAYIIYYMIHTNDLLLSIVAKNINPFSIMSGHDKIDGIELVFKIIIAYLIYQLIISIRQNTRRK